MTQTSASRVPPYGPFKAFMQILSDMRGSVVPNRLDSTYWGSGKSGSTLAALNTAFKFFGLVKDSKEAEPKLSEFIKAFKENEKEALSDLVFDAYQDALGKINDLDGATLGQLNDAFRTTYSVDGDMLKKAVRFFIHAATEAGTKLSPHITRTARGIGRPVRSGVRPAIRRRSRTITAPPQSPTSQGGTPTRPSVAELLLEKFPDFDPDWSEETKQKWFDSLRDLKQLLQDEKGN